MTRLFFNSLLLFSLSACSYFMPNPPCPPPPSAKKPLTDTYSCDSPTTPRIHPSENEVLAICDLVDIALQNSPKTRAAWYAAKERATAVGTARGAYLPPIMFTGTWMQYQLSQVNLNLESLNWERNVSFGFSTSYLLYDFGGRNARLCMALAALTEANWLYNWDVQSVILDVVQNYYNYVNALGVFEAMSRYVAIAERTVEVAKALRETGIQSISDELQAETLLFEASIQLEESKLAVDISMATLVKSVSLPPNTKLNIAPLPEKIETDGISDDVNCIMKIAKNNRADLMASRAVVLEHREKVRAARSDFLPNIQTQLCGSRVSLNDQRFLDNYKFEVDINVPLFSSFADINALRAAQAGVLRAQAELDSAESMALLDVVSDYYEYLSNATILNYSCKYLETADKNQELALSNYEVGIGTILDVIFANKSFITARIQLVDAKTNFLTALANIAYDTGGLSFEAIRSNQSISPSLIETGERVDSIEPCVDDTDHPVLQLLHKQDEPLPAHFPGQGGGSSEEGHP